MPASKLKSTFVDHGTTKADSQGSFVKSMAIRIRDRAQELGLSQTDVADRAEIKRSSMGNYWPGERPYPVEAVPRLADALNTSVEWLLTGRVASQRAVLTAASDADWVDLPLYDLHNVEDQSLGPPELTTPVRRDWLSTNVRTTSGLWLTRLLSDYRAADLHEGMMVLCRSIEATELAEGHLCLWRYNGRIVIGRFSVVADALASAGIKSFNPDGDYQTHELAIAPSQIANGDEGYHLVGRILSTFMRPI